jgi:hypothetical protein
VLTTIFIDFAEVVGVNNNFLVNTLYIEFDPLNKLLIKNWCEVFTINVGVL